MMHKWLNDAYDVVSRLVMYQQNSVLVFEWLGYAFTHFFK
jgi:hypothetical protein